MTSQPVQVNRNRTQHPRTLIRTFHRWGEPSVNGEQGQTLNWTAACARMKERTASRSTRGTSWMCTLSKPMGRMDSCTAAANDSLRSRSTWSTLKVMDDQRWSKSTAWSVSVRSKTRVDWLGTWSFSIPQRKRSSSSVIAARKHSPKRICSKVT